MGVLVLNMIRARASGVLYTIDPNSGHSDDVLVSAAWGLGVSVVDGSMDVDFWRVRREGREIVSAKIARKDSQFSGLPQGGIVSQPCRRNCGNAPA
jgi:pyruvate,water dikinase